MSDASTTSASETQESSLVQLPVSAMTQTTDDDVIEDVEDADSEDSLTFSNGVIEKIVAIACRDVPGVVGMKGGFFKRVQETLTGADLTKGVTVEVMQDNSVRVNISILMAYGAYAPQVFEDVKKAVVRELSSMTGLEVSGVNLRIEDVIAADELDDDEREAN
ncbi:Asp23/Gls24 family envelope stress response protein [Olsenella sp. KGMB02461]|nr:Asp23/Gls24 family envelope stress response protein [Olsenella sp. KGMB02461]